jgi:hypothetical protein
MSTYNEIFGGKINVVGSDPANPIKGQVWFNTATPALKYRGLTPAAWASGGNLATARSALAGCGTQTLALAFGGDDGSVTAVTEEYNGTAWTGGGNLATARGVLGGAGTQTAGLAFAGAGTYPTVFTSTEEYDGSSWTGGGNMATARRSLGGCGIQTSALGFGGYVPAGGGSNTAATEEYNGTAWTGGGNLGTARRNLSRMQELKQQDLLLVEVRPCSSSNRRI